MVFRWSSPEIPITWRRDWGVEVGSVSNVFLWLGRENAWCSGVLLLCGELASWEIVVDGIMMGWKMMM